MSVVHDMHELALPEAGDLRLSQPPSKFVNACEWPTVDGR